MARLLVASLLFAPAAADFITDANCVNAPTDMVTADSSGFIKEVDDACALKASAVLRNSTTDKWVDVRRVDEFEGGHCKGIVNIVWNSDACWKTGYNDPACKGFVDKMASLVDGKYNTPIFVHCKSGNRAGQVAKFLQGRSWANSKLSSGTGSAADPYTSTYTGTKFTKIYVSKGNWQAVCGSEVETGSATMDELLNICGEGTAVRSAPTKRHDVDSTISKCMAPTLALTSVQKQSVFLDVRRKDEFEAGHCKGISNIVWDSDACWKNGYSDATCKKFVDDLVTLVGGDYTKPIFIHCKSGNRAGQVANFLQGKDWANPKLSSGKGSAADPYKSTYDGTKFSTFVVSAGNYVELCGTAIEKGSVESDPSTISSAPFGVRVVMPPIILVFFALFQ